MIFFIAKMIQPEPLKKSCSHAVETVAEAVFLIFGFVSAQFGFPSLCQLEARN